MATGTFSRDSILTGLNGRGTWRERKASTRKSWWPRWISIDWGFEAPCGGLLARASDMSGNALKEERMELGRSGPSTSESSGSGNQEAREGTAGQRGSSERSLAPRSFDIPRVRDTPDTATRAGARDCCALRWRRGLAEDTERKHGATTENASHNRSARKSTRSIFRPTHLRTAPMKLPSPTRWATYLWRLDCRVPFQQITIAWAVGC